MQLLVMNWDVEARPQPPPEASPAAASAPRFQQGSPRWNVYWCQACGRGEGCHGNGLLKCGKCRGAHYCSKECQEAHWPTHKLQCKEIQLGQQCFADSVGMEVATAYKAWINSIKPLVFKVAAALLWPAPHLPPRNRSHGLLLHVTYDKSATPLRFQLGAVEELTLEEISARTASANGGKGIQWPPTGPDPDRLSEMMKIMVVLGQWECGAWRSMHLKLTGQMLSELKDGTVKLPSVEETITLINMMS